MRNLGYIMLMSDYGKVVTCIGDYVIVILHRSAIESASISENEIAVKTLCFVCFCLKHSYKLNVPPSVR